jgi:adenine-specific DNA-methyltransferase
MKFNERYQRAEFLEFLGDFLPEDFVEKEEDIVVSKPRHKEITKAQILGESKLLELSVLEVEHDSENDPRVALATDAFKILADHWIHRALVIFKSKNSENYRFSYLTISLDLNEKNKVTRKYSNARRYSFYLGPNAKIKTPEQQLIKKGHVKDTEDLLNRFSLEVVNKAFYLQIASAFDSLVGELSPKLLLPSTVSHEVNAHKNFAVRLIGRIMFCWFLKQKKSESGPLISDQLLSSTAVENTKGYYHTILEPLFFEVLNTPKTDRGIRDSLYDQVPYLNGGLFSPQHDDYYDLDRSTYSSRHINTLKIEDDWFRDLFALLETYNFTIDENTVFDQELSVDPEMLGRIFENLLAEINPETGSSERKRTGSFYTPRQIVEYMVDQSLLSYLKNKTGIVEERLEALISYDQEDDANNPLTKGEKHKIVEAVIDLRVIDPACGSGAFPVGMLQKIVYILQHVDTDCSVWIDKKLEAIPDLWKQRIQEYYTSHPANYIRKLDIIKGSIFGVDIQPIAVEVARLRCFLTLVVESQIDDSVPNRGIDPLPNLEFKFVCADALMSLPETASKGMFDDHIGIEVLSQIMGDYFTASGSKKEETKLKFTRTQSEIFRSAVAMFGQSTGELTQKLTFWDPFGNTSSSWFDPKWMFGIENGFDVIIGNPPYIQLQKEGGKLAKQYEHSGYEAFEKTGDIYSLFYEKGFELLKRKGHLVYITSNKWMRAGYGKSLRKFFSQKTNPILLIDFAGQKIFESATVDTSILLFSKEENEGKTLACVVKEKVLNNLSVFVRQRGSIGNFKTTESWSILSPIETQIREKIKQTGIPLKNWEININYGVKTGLNDAFIISGDKRKELIDQDPKSEELIRPILRGRDIKRYKYEFNDKYVILAYFDSHKILKDDYPAIYKHLLQYKAQLEQRGQCRYTSSGRPNQNGEYLGQHHWLELDNNPTLKKLDDFYKQKIVWGNLNLRATYSIAEAGMFVNAPCPMIVPASKYLLAVLNSKLADYYIKNLGVTRNGGYFEYKPMFIEKLPVPHISEQLETKFAELVEKRTSASKKDEIDLAERELDRLVYSLYQLTPEEIKIIEKN